MCKCSRARRPPLVLASCKCSCPSAFAQWTAPWKTLGPAIPCLNSVLAWEVHTTSTYWIIFANLAKAPNEKKKTQLLRQLHEAALSSTVWYSKPGLFGDEARQGHRKHGVLAFQLQFLNLQTSLCHSSPPEVLLLRRKGCPRLGPFQLRVYQVVFLVRCVSGSCPGMQSSATSKELETPC